MKDWTSEDVFKLEEMWKAGYSAREIAKELNRSLDSVYWKIRALNLPKRRRYNSKEHDKEILRLFNKSLSVNQIAKILGISVTPVRRVLKEHNLYTSKRPSLLVAVEEAINLYGYALKRNLRSYERKMLLRHNFKVVWLTNSPRGSAKCKSCDLFGEYAGYHLIYKNVEVAERFLRSLVKPGCEKALTHWINDRLVSDHASRS